MQQAPWRGVWCSPDLPGIFKAFQPQRAEKGTIILLEVPNEHAGFEEEKKLSEKETWKVGTVAHTCNPNTLGG